MTSRRNLLKTASGVVAATVVGGALMDTSQARAQESTGEASTLSADGSSEMFVTIEGTQQKFKSESVRKGFEKAVPAISFTYGVKSPRDSASGQASGKRQHKPITFIKEWGASTPQLFQALVTNEQLKSVTIEFVQTSSGEGAGGDFVYHTIKLTNAYVTELDQFKRSSPDDPRDLEAVSFTHQKIEMTNDGVTATDTTSK